MILKFFITIFIVSLIGYTAEAFPTNVRPKVLGLCVTFGRIGVVMIPLYITIDEN